MFFSFTQMKMDRGLNKLELANLEFASLRLCAKVIVAVEDGGNQEQLWLENRQMGGTARSAVCVS